ncbi:hypothetical protein ACQP1V_36275 [Microtetraspora malaysiensis]|uniref:hypothetical protein n=1 Tax=Microtetraspora malaysiensis TaxID=161358 RepID=UPI003D8E0C0F
MTRAETRLWRTVDGGLVADGHPDAESLAYAEGDEISEADQERLVEEKKAGRPTNKARKATEDK